MREEQWGNGEKDSWCLKLMAARGRSGASHTNAAATANAAAIAAAAIAAAATTTNT